MPVESSSILLFRFCFELDEFEKVGDPLFRLPFRDIEEIREDDQVLRNGQVDIQGDFLGDDSRHPLDGPVVDMGGHPVDDQAARSHGRDAVDHFYGGRLTGAVRAQEAEAFALFDLKGDPVNGREGAIFFCQICGRNEHVHDFRWPP